MRLQEKESRAAEPKYYNNAFFWGQHHPALAAAHPGRQHLLLWALQREKTTLWWGQSKPWISLLSQSISQMLPRCSSTGDAPNGPSWNLPLVQHWAEDGVRATLDILGSLSRGFPKFLQPHRGSQMWGEPLCAYLEPCGPSHCRELEG